MGPEVEMRWVTGRNGTILVALLGVAFVIGLLFAGVSGPFVIAIGTAIAVAIVGGTQGHCRPSSSSRE